MRKIPPLNALKAFEASGRHLNFRLAAEELGVTHGAVAQHVRALEAQLNIRLFERRSRGLSLTDEGRRYLAPLRRAFDLIADATADLRPQDNVVTLSSTPSFATKWLVPRLGDFSGAHPHIRLRLDASNALANFQSDGVDIAIRLGRPPFGPGLTSDPLFSSTLIAICNPDLTDNTHPIRTPEDLQQHVLLQDTHGQWPLFLQQVFGDLPLPDMQMMTFSQTSLAIDAAIAGQGIALCNRAFVESDLKAGRLCQPVATQMETEHRYHIVAPRRPRQPALVETVRTWLLQNT